MSWLYLALAIVLEVCGTTAMKLSDGLTKLVPSLAIVVFYGLSFTALAMALKRLEVSVAYAIWAGAGTGLISVIGVLYFKEEMSLLKVLSLALIVAGVIGLNLGGGAE